MENNEYPRIKWMGLKKQVSNTFCEDCSDGAAALPSLAGHGFVRHWDRPRPRAAAVLFGDPLLPPKPTTSSSLAIAVTESLVSLSVKSDGPTRTDKRTRTVGRLAHYGFLVRNIGCETDRRPRRFPPVASLGVYSRALSIIPIMRLQNLIASIPSEEKGISN